MMADQRTDVGAALKAAAAERILVLDGAMGTMIQDLKLDERAFAALLRQAAGSL